MAKDSLAQMDDDEIVLRMMDGDEDGLRALLVQYGGRIRAYLRAFYGDVLASPEIDEALNVASLKVWRAASTYDESQGKLGGWFLRIAQNAARNLIRSEARHRGQRSTDDPSLEAALDDPDDDCEPDGSLTKEDERVARALEAAIEQLPGLQKAIMKADLACGGTADAKRLAAETGSPVASIYVSRNKARAKLREELTRQGFYRDDRKAKR